MTDFGVVPEGFREKTYADIIAELEQAEREAFGAGINTQADSVLGQLNGIFADKLAELWETSLAVYRSRHPDFSTGEALDEVAAITGAYRLPAAPSAVTLHLNLDNGTTVPAGSLASIGASGSQWETKDPATNGTGVAATIAVAAESVESAPVVGNAEAIDTIVTPVAGWSAKAALTSLGQEPFTLVNGQTLTLKVDNGADQTATFLTGDFALIGAATAAEVASVLASAIAGLSSSAAGPAVRIQSSLAGSGSSVQVVGGTASPALAFVRERIRGFNPDRTAKLLNGQSAPYALAPSDTLFVKVDGGASQTITFLAPDFVSIGAATALEVARVLHRDLVGATAYELAGKVQIESLVFGSNSRLEVSGGSANLELLFPLEEPVAGSLGDAVLGRDVENDADFRLRREELLRISGAGTLEAIRSRVRGVDGVLQAFAFENTDDLPDIDGRPGHSFEVVVQGGASQAIGQAIFDAKPAGIESYRVPGPEGVTVLIEDSQGDEHDINFSRATETEFYIDVDVTAVQVAFGGGDQLAGEQQVKEVLKLVGDEFGIGALIVATRLLCGPLTVAGVQDVTGLRFESVFPPLNTANIQLGAREIGRWSTANISVNVVFV